MKVLTVANRKGGAGKSTCAAHISLESVKKGLQTILIDLDPQKTLEGWWGKRDDEQPFLADASAANLLETLEKIGGQKFDLCIIDTPGDTSANAISGIEVADLVLIPSKPTSPDLSAIGRTISMVKDAQKNFFFVVTQAISQSKTALQAASVLSEFGPVAPSTISHRVSYMHAMSSGISATELDKIALEEVSSLWDYLFLRLSYEEKKEKKAKIIA
ncbi:MAG: AAA family ATPase [Cetobacterium sp.]